MIKRFASAFKTRDDVFDNITPNNIVQPKVSHPAGEWKPAAWLPVQWKGEASKDYFVMSSGKVAALDASGKVVPAGLGLGTTASGIAFRYTSADIEAKTEDIRTGEACNATSLLTNVTNKDLLEAAISRGLIDWDGLIAGAAPFDGTNNDADTVALMPLFISKPIGVLAYDVYSWAGDAPGGFKFTNYQKQHLIQFITEAQMKAPQMAATAQVAKTITGLLAATSGVFPAGSTPVSLDVTLLRALERYENEADEVLHVKASASVKAVYLGARQVVPEINALTLADTATTLSGTLGMATALVNRKSRAADVKSLGDYFLDAEVGIVIVHDTATLTGDVNHYVYSGAASTAHQGLYFVGECKPGDYITFDSESNFTVDSNPGFGTAIGRVLEVQQFPKSLMERTTTAWQGSSFDASMRMPGTATEGLPDNLTLSGRNGEVVGNRMVIANIRIL